MADTRTLGVLVKVLLAVLVIASALVLLEATPVARADDDHGDYRSTATPLPIGTGQLNGQIDPTTILFDVDYFSFEALRGVSYTFVLDFGTVENANFQVVNSKDRGAYASPGQTLTNGESNKRIEWIARTTDTYFVEVSGTIRSDGTPLHGAYLLTGTGDLSLWDRHGEMPGSSSTISVDNVYQGAISPWTNQPGLTGTKDGGDDHDYFRFQAIRGVKYTVDVELGTAEGVDIAMVDGSNLTQITNDSLGASLEWISPGTAVYYIVLSGSGRFRNSIGSYQLRLTADVAYQDRHGETHTSATAVRFDNAHQGAISPETDNDVFYFQAQRGVRYNINASLGTVQAITLSVEDTGGERVASNVGVGTTLEWIPQVTDMFYIVVSGSSQVKDTTGTYALVVEADSTLEDRHGGSVDEATQITFGNEHRGAVSPATDRDYFSFEARRGIRYTIDVDLGTAPGAEITILDVAGEVEASNAGVGTTLDWTAVTAGIYYVVIAAPSQVSYGVGTYALRVEDDNSLMDRHGDTEELATPVVVGSTYRASLSPAGDLDYFTFRSDRGVRYSFEIIYGTAGAVSLTVSKANGGQVAARNFGEGTDVIWIAPDDGDYVVAVSGSPRVQDTTGTYSLKIGADMTLKDRYGGNPGTATKFVLGNALAGAVSPDDDEDYFFFDAKRGEEYVVQVDLGTVDAVRLSVTQTLAGFAATNFSEGTSLEWQAPITGRYFIVVSAWELASDPVGTYHLTLREQGEVPDATPTSTLEPTPPPATPTPAPTPSTAPVPTPPPEGPALFAESRTAQAGGTVLVPVMLQETRGLSSLGFTLIYDPSVVELVNVSKGARLRPATFSYNGDVPGAIRMGFASTTGLSGGGSAVIVEFRVIGETDANTLFTLSEVLANDSDGNRLPLGIGSGLFTVGKPETGDGNGDSQITALDALIALKMVRGMVDVDLVMDLNGDGMVTTEDVRQILATAGRG